MPPNTQHNQAQQHQVSFIDHFWSKDKSGMNKLLKYINATHQDLERMHAIYIQRSIMEREFGERLLQLSKESENQENPAHGGSNGGVLAVYGAISAELRRTATTHLELSNRLKNQIANECQAKLTEYRKLLSTWTESLNNLYQGRTERTMELLKIREQYLKEHDAFKGQSTPTMESLKNQYKALVVKVDEISQEWNSEWKEACEVLEAMEEDRIEFLKNNMWEYANLASATLLIQDECCENIRKQLEVCQFEQEIEKCVSLYATGSKIPTTNEYVGELMKEQKKKHQNERSSTDRVPKPPSKPPRQQGTQIQQDQNSKHMQTKQFAQEQKDVHVPFNTESRQQEQPESLSKEECQQQQQQQQQQPKLNQKKPSEISAIKQQEMNSTTNPKNDLNNQYRANISNNMGSTATRGQIKRKPLNKSLMEQVSSEIAQARQQHVIDQQNTSCSSVRSEKSTKKSETNGSLDILLKSFEGSTSPSSSTTSEDSMTYTHPNALVSDEARARRQPSEYKPDTGSVRRSNHHHHKKQQHNTSHVLQEVAEAPLMNTTLQSTRDPASYPVAAPKSPRPPAQQISRDLQNKDVYNNDEYLTQAVYGSMAQQSSPNMVQQMQQSLPDQNSGYSQYPSYAGQQQHFQQQHYMGASQSMAQPPIQQRSPLIQPQRSPLIQPLTSPMIQPTRSPMMQPSRSPMMQPSRSPMIQPAHSPMLQPQRGGTLPPPITIPANFVVTPQPSPSISYSNLGSISPGGILPPANHGGVPYNNTHSIPPRPLHYTDGRPVQFWARAKYDYDAKDSDELSFKANNLMGILEADVTQQSWWVGAIYDEFRQTWSIAASVPSNFMNSF